MKNKIVQHIPPFVVGILPKIIEFETLEELLDIPFVKKFKEDVGFYQYSISHIEELKDSSIYLIAEMNLGKNQWVVGYLNEKVDLPKWRNK